MFDVDSFSIADAMQESHDYKIIRIGAMIYVLPADSDFTALAASEAYTTWVNKSVLVVNGEGNVMSNRFGATTKRDFR